MSSLPSVVNLDEFVRRNVEDELRWDARVQPNEIGVVVSDGIATLTGSVDSLLKKWAAEEAAQRVHGVRAVANEIAVRLPNLSERSDSDIARAVANAFEWDASVPERKIRVAVENGRVTLSGEVEWEHQRRAAEEATRRLLGVKAIDNRIVIQPRAVAAGLRESIEAALVRGAKHDAQKITVEVKGTTVVLRGTVRSLAERQQAAATAWSAPGVRILDNRLTVAM